MDLASEHTRQCAGEVSKFLNNRGKSATLKYEFSLNSAGIYLSIPGNHWTYRVPGAEIFFEPGPMPL
jgi:hypothetical protein